MKVGEGYRSRLRRQQTMFGWLSVLPALILILSVKGYPIVFGFLKSFRNWTGFGQGEFIGLTNYINIITSNEIWTLLKNNFIILIFIPIQLFIGLLVAVLLHEEVFGWKFFRVVFYLPQIISPLVIGYLFKVFFSYDGPINLILESLNLGFTRTEWLGEVFSAMSIIILCLVWINIGWQAMLGLGGLSSISINVFEAAQIDGAGFWRRFFTITLPMLGRTIEFSCIISVMWVFTGIFPYIFSITRGGPGYGTTTIDYMIYLRSFGAVSKPGYASALAMVLLVIVLILTLIQMRLSRHTGEWEG
jgi:ABC-type sugar transport system permease subunit